MLGVRSNGDRAFDIDPPTSSYAIMRRARSYRGANSDAGKDIRGELASTPGIREQHRPEADSGSGRSAQMPLLILANSISHSPALGGRGRSIEPTQIRPALGVSSFSRASEMAEIKCMTCSTFSFTR